MTHHVASTESPEIKCHTKCRKYFGDAEKLEANLNDSTTLPENECTSMSEDDTTQTFSSTSAGSTLTTRSKVVHLPSPSDQERECFVCNKRRKKVRGREESLLKLQEERAEATLVGVMDANENSDDPVLHSAAKRLRIHHAGGDLLARELEYHKSCYTFFTVHPTKNLQSDISLDTINSQCAEREFLDIIEKKVIVEKSCYFLTDLLEDMQNLYVYHGVPAHSRKTFTSQIKDLISSKFKEKVEFKRASGIHGAGNILHSTDVNPLDYSLATIRGAGLRDDNITKAFARMVHRKITRKKSCDDDKSAAHVHASFENLVGQLDEHEPMQEIYNAIAMSLNPSFKKNDHGFVVIPSSQATKVWSIAGHWQQLLTGDPSPSALALGMVIHRITGSKEAINLLSKSGVTPSYTTILETSKKWAQDATTELKRRKVPPCMQPFKPTHITLDNNDGRQMTLTGVGTTHDTTGTINQPTLPGEAEYQSFQTTEERCLTIDDDDQIDYGDYKIGKPKSPPIIKEYKPDKDESELEGRLDKDFAWALAASSGDQTGIKGHEVLDLDKIEDEEVTSDFVGSWTAFNKKVTSVETTKSRNEYLPTIPHPPDDSICKYYLDYIIDLADSLHLEHIFVHCDQAVFYKMSQIMWKELGKYNKIKCLMGGFHILLVWLKVLNKQFGA